MKRSRWRVAAELPETSYLRSFDPRAKLALALSASFAVMLPLPTLCIFFLGMGTILVTAGIAGRAVREAMRLRWLLLLLFLLDWAFVGIELAVAVTLRIVLLVSSFQIVLATTTPAELQRALRQLGMPARVAFSLGVAQQSLTLLQADVRRILEAQQARGIRFTADGVTLRTRARMLWDRSLAVVIPAIVVATQRAWAAHEAAAVRGFGGPHGQAVGGPAMERRDYGLLMLSVSSLCALAWLR